jgi:hypothetical protein
LEGKKCGLFPVDSGDGEKNEKLFSALVEK